MPASLVLLLPRRAVLAGPERLPALERILARGVRLPLDAARGHPWLEHLIDLPRRPWPWAAKVAFSWPTATRPIRPQAERNRSSRSSA